MRLAIFLILLGATLQATTIDSSNWTVVAPKLLLEDEPEFVAGGILSVKDFLDPGSSHEVITQSTTLLASPPFAGGYGRDLPPPDGGGLLENPEAGSLLLLGTGFAALFLLRRSR